jgi:hypothetical protein
MEILLAVIFVWMYRYIGVLLYRLENVSSEYEKTRVDYPDGPNLLAFLIQKITRHRLHWLFYHTGSWHYVHNKKDLVYVLKQYKEIYLWPFRQVFKFYRIYKRNIISHLYSILHLEEKKLLKNSMFAELKNEMSAELKKFKLLGIRKDGCKYNLHVKLPKNALDLLGPWKNKKGFRFESSFNGWAEKYLESKLELPRQREKISRTEIIVVVYWGIFCDPSYCWGDFQKEKWEKWKKDLISFFQKISSGELKPQLS